MKRRRCRSSAAEGFGSQMEVIRSTKTMPFSLALESAGEGQVTPDIARRLIRAREGDELDSLMSAASVLRDNLKGRTITYSKKVFIPLTNLCRDYCGYCTFRKDPDQQGARTMTPDDVLAIAEAAARMGCKEALFSLGDRPEAIFPEMRDTLRRLGHETTLSYLSEMCRLVIDRTGLLPHPNAGVMGRRDMQSLRRSSPSMGLMLETSSERLSGRGMAHADAPDKKPVVRLKTIEEAGKLRIPFTTGILIGIGETLDERVDSLLAIDELNRQYGHIQEVIIQNFRAKPDIPMHDQVEPTTADLARTIAVARLMLGEMNIQAPPNLTANNYQYLIGAGLNDWGGISPLTPDYINPEKPWPHLESLAARTSAAGYELRERLAIYPEFAVRDEFMEPEVAALVRSKTNECGLAR